MSLLKPKTVRGSIKASKLQQVEKFEYLGTEDGTRRLMQGLVEQMQFCVNIINRSAVTKRELSNNAKLSVSN